MDYKYENVVAKRDFEVFRHDENGELIGIVTVPKGCKGIVESMGWSSTDDFRVNYAIRFVEDDNEIEVGIYEDDMELYLDIL